MKEFIDSLNEFFWMWLASISPVLLIWLFLELGEEEYSFGTILGDVFLAGPIFAYVATLLAPFLFVIYKLITGKKRESLKFGGTALVITVVVTVFSTFLFYHKQSQLFAEDRTRNINELVVKEIPQRQLDQALQKVRKDLEAKSFTAYEYSERDIFALFCYLAALILFFYSIYINNKGAPDPSDMSRAGTTRMKQVIDKEYGGERA